MDDLDIVYKEDLDSLICVCGSPACENTLVLHCLEHPEDATWVAYFNGILQISCSYCGEILLSIGVAGTKSVTEIEEAG